MPVQPTLGSYNNAEDDSIYMATRWESNRKYDLLAIYYILELRFFCCLLYKSKWWLWAVLGKSWSPHFSSIPRHIMSKRNKRHRSAYSSYSIWNNIKENCMHWMSEERKRDRAQNKNKIKTWPSGKSHIRHRSLYIVFIHVKLILLLHLRCKC